MSIVNSSPSDGIIFHNRADKKQKTKTTQMTQLLLFVKPLDENILEFPQIKSGCLTNKLKINELIKHVITFVSRPTHSSPFTW